MGGCFEPFDDSRRLVADGVKSCSDEGYLLLESFAGVFITVCNRLMQFDIELWEQISAAVNSTMAS